MQKGAGRLVGSREASQASKSGSAPSRSMSLEDVGRRKEEVCATLAAPS